MKMVSQICRNYTLTRQSLSSRLALKLAPILLCVFSASAHAGLIVTDSVQSLASQSQNNIPVTFGQIFSDNAVPAGSTVNATLNGEPVVLQVDAKAFNPDGSLRHAVLTAMIPSLATDTTEPLQVSLASPSTQGSAVTLAQLLATQYDAKATFNIGGIAYSADARQLLQTAQTAGSCKPWGTSCNVWLSGPLVSEWIVDGPVTTAGGTANPNLAVYFDVRAYAGATSGSIGYIRTNIVVENTWAYTAQAAPKYTANLTSGSASYASTTLTQYPYTRWHQILWWNNQQPQAYLREDTQYIQSTGAVSRYEILQPDEAFLNGVRQSCPPLQNCDQTKNMGNTGAQDAIGPLPRWTTTYIIDPDVRAFNYMIANADAAGAYSFHYRDRATGDPLSIVAHPYVTIADWGYANGVAAQNPSTWGKDLLPQCTGCGTAFYNTTNIYKFDNAHHPSIGFVPYMVTGDFYYLQEMDFTASYLELWANPGYRNYAQGLVYAAEEQTRGKAWTLRSIGDAAYLAPDNDPMKAEFNNDINNAISDFIQQTVNNPSANPLGLVSNFDYSVNGGTHNAGSPWQDDFLTWAAGHLMDEGFSGASQLLNWKAKFQIGLMTDWTNNATQGYCWLEASAYAPEFIDASGNFLPTFSAVYQANFPTLYGLACNSPAMVSAMGALEGQTWQQGEMHGYPNSPTGFPANLQIGLAMAAQSTDANAQNAWQLFQGRSIQPTPPTGYNDDPNFAVLPRYLPYVPIINIYASPNPVAPGQATVIYWNASDATSCTAKWTSSSATSGKTSISAITAAVTYPISCTGPNGTATASVTVGVSNASAPPSSAAPAPAPAPQSPSPGKTGGGSTDWFVLLGFIVLVVWRRKKPCLSRTAD